MAPIEKANAPREAPQWMQDLGKFLGWMIVPPLVIGVLVLVAALGLLVFVPFLPPLLGEFMSGSAGTVDQERRRAKKSARSVVPLGGRTAHG